MFLMYLDYLFILNKTYFETEKKKWKKKKKKKKIPEIIARNIGSF